MSKLRRWKLIKSQMVLNHRWCQVRQDEIELPSGEVIDDFFVHINPDIALTLAITTNHEVVMVRQYRHGMGDFFLELPAGGIEPQQEDAKLAAMRELEEETGYVARDLQEIAVLYDRPSKDTNRTHLFFAKNVEKSSQQRLDVTEDIEVVLVPIREISAKIASGEICVMSSVTALLIGLRKLGIELGSD